MLSGEQNELVEREHESERQRKQRALLSFPSLVLARATHAWLLTIFFKWIACSISLAADVLWGSFVTANNVIKNVKCPILFEFRVLSKTFWTRTLGFRTTKFSLTRRLSYLRLIVYVYTILRYWDTEPLMSTWTIPGPIWTVFHIELIAQEQKIRWLEIHFQDRRPGPLRVLPHYSLFCGQLRTPS